MRADFITKLRRVPRQVHHSYQIARRAEETCTTACAHKFYLTFSSQEMLRPTLLQNAALVRGLRNSTPTYPTFGPIVLSSFAACGSVHNRSCACSALYLSGARISSVQALLRVPRLRADLATLPQLKPHIGRYPYRVMSCAEPCKAARIQRFQFIFQSIKPLSSPFPQNAVPGRGLSYFSATRPRP